MSLDATYTRELPLVEGTNSFKDIDDVVVMNQHRVSQSNYTGTSYGRYACFGTGSTQSRSKTVGDIVFNVKEDLRLDLTRSQILMEL